MTSGGLAAVSSSAFAALYSAFGKYDVVHIHAEGPAFFAWLPKMFGKRVVVTVHGECEIIRGCHNRDNVREKLATAETFAANHLEYQVNVEYLKRVQPKDLNASEIEVRLGANWIKAEYACIEQHGRAVYHYALLAV